MRNVVVRRPLPEEAETLSQIAQDSKRHWGYPEGWLDLWRDGMRITAATLREREFWTAQVGEEIAGLYSISPMGEGEYDLEDFWVAPEFIEQGIGRAMFQHLRRRLLGLGGERLRIVSDPHAVGFYEQMGALPVGEEPSLPEGRVLPVLIYHVGE